MYAYVKASHADAPSPRPLIPLTLSRHRASVGDPSRASTLALRASRHDESDVGGRRDVLRRTLAAASAAAATTLTSPPAARALVQGNPPPTGLRSSSSASSSAPRTKQLSEEYLTDGTAAMAESVEAEVLPREAYKKLDSGVIYADISKGSGEEVAPGKRLNAQWILRRSNGYFVDSSAVSDSVPFIFTVGKGDAIKGVDEGVLGMRVGGTRRILIPPSLAWVQGIDDGKPGPLPAGFGPRQQMRRVMTLRADVPGEYIFLEVKVTKVR